MNIHDYIIDSNEPDLIQSEFSVVKLTCIKTTDQVVSIQVIYKKSHQTILETCLKELETWKKIHHPNIVECYRYFETKNQLYIVMEYVPGESLLTFLTQRLESNQPLSENFIYKFFKQIVSALSYVHGLHLIHLNIKLENVIFYKKHQIQLIGFDISEISASSNLNNLDNKCNLIYKSFE
jgi:serine/threonine protein kinase